MRPRSLIEVKRDAMSNAQMSMSNALLAIVRRLTLISEVMKS